MCSPIISDKCIGSEEDLLFWRYMELCVDFFVNFAYNVVLLKENRRDTCEAWTEGCREEAETDNPSCLSVVLYDFSELMWSMYSVAMFLNCALCCYFSVFRPFEYGIMTLFALPRQKKPPDLVSEGSKIRVCSNYDYDSRYDYFIARQQFLAKVLCDSLMRTIVHHEQSRRSSMGVKPAQTVEETPIVEATKLQCTPCTDATDDIPLDDSVQQALPPENADPVALLTIDFFLFWMS